MISFMISVAPPKIDCTRLSRKSSQSCRSRGLMLPPVKAGLPLVSASRGVRACAMFTNTDLSRYADRHTASGIGSLRGRFNAIASHRRPSHPLQDCEQPEAGDNRSRVVTRQAERQRR